MISLISKQTSFHLKFLTSWIIPENFTGCVECPNGDKYWLLNEKRHRTNGPAIEHFNGAKDWFVNGKEYSEKQWQKEVKKLNDKFVK